MDTPDREPHPLPGTTEPPPPEAGGTRRYEWEWGREEDRGVRLPWVGIFLVIFGALLLVDRALPQFFVASNLLVLALGLSALIVWLLRRNTFALYAGAFLTASAVPGLVRSLNYNAPNGLGTLSFGVALLFIAAVRFQRGGGVGWQALLGLVLVALGGSQLALPNLADVLLPVALVVVGVVLLTRRRG